MLALSELRSRYPDLTYFLLFLIRRILLALVTLAVLSTLVFFLVNMLPGDVGRILLGHEASAESVARLNHELGLDRPLLDQYKDWITGLLSGDLGTSIQYKIPVADLLWTSLWNSVRLVSLALLIAFVLAVMSGMIAGLRAGRAPDRVLTITGSVFLAVPDFVFGIGFIVIFALGLGWFPTSARIPEGTPPLGYLHYLILPAIVIALYEYAFLQRHLRASVIETLQSDYTRTAYLMGGRSIHVALRHVLRNSLAPTLAVLAVHVGALIGGSVVVEVMFNYDGVGRRIVTAAEAKDFPLLGACVLAVGTIYIAATLVVDIVQPGRVR